MSVRMVVLLPLLFLLLVVSALPSEIPEITKSSTDDLKTDESLNAPIYLTIVQQSKETDYYPDQHHHHHHHPPPGPGLYPQPGPHHGPGVYPLSGPPSHIYSRLHDEEHYFEHPAYDAKIYVDHPKPLYHEPKPYDLPYPPKGYPREPLYPAPAPAPAPASAGPHPPKYEYHLSYYENDGYGHHYSPRPLDLEPPLEVLLERTHHENIAKVKSNYRKGSRAFEHTFGKVFPVHVIGDKLYKDPPPHGYITAKYEQPYPPLEPGYEKAYPAPAPGYEKSYPAPGYEKPYPAPAIGYEKPYPAPAPGYVKSYPAPAPGYEKTYYAPAPGYEKTYPAPPTQVHLSKYHQEEHFLLPPPEPLYPAHKKHPYYNHRQAHLPPHLDHFFGPEPLPLA